MVIDRPYPFLSHNPRCNRSCPRFLPSSCFQCIGRLLAFFPFAIFCNCFDDHVPFINHRVPGAHYTSLSVRKGLLCPAPVHRQQCRLGDRPAVGGSVRRASYKFFKLRQHVLFQPMPLQHVFAYFFLLCLQRY